MGGLARRATLIQDTRDQTDVPVLVVDAGNTLMGKSLSLASEGRVLVDAMNLMGYDALGIGVGELIQGPEILEARAQEASFPLVSANLVDAATGEPLFEPWVLIERKGTRFGVLGLSNPGALLGIESLWPGAEILPAQQALTRYLDEVRSQSDVVVVLSLLGLDSDQVLAQNVAGIDVIVGGNERYLLTEASSVNNTTIVQVGYDGEWLGQLDLTPADQGFAGVYTVLYMRPEVADDADMRALVTRYYEEYLP
ncbi:MAG: hypothetical protein ACOX2L_09805 [Anaerolineae bacterium]|jgi:2',3'-cyclic-nucleotide 2'-phosphodiesterase (5'-nucleotidase family)|nr:hypothetical protein [Chloroflexota bacterium]